MKAGWALLPVLQAACYPLKVQVVGGEWVVGLVPNRKAANTAAPSLLPRAAGGAKAAVLG